VKALGYFENEFAFLDHVPIGMFVLGKDWTVLFWNTCLEQWTNIPRTEIVGIEIATRFPHLKNPVYRSRLDGVFAGGPPVIFSSQLHKYIIPVPHRDEQMRIQHTTVTAVPASDGAEFYALVAIQDVTDLTYRVYEYRAMRDQAREEAKERKHAEISERKQRVLAEALLDTSAALVSTLQFDEVLDRILMNVERVIPHELVDILLVEDGVARIARSHSHVENETARSVVDLRLNVADMPNLRQMIATGQPLVISDVREYAGWVDIPQTRWIRSHASAPIYVKDQVVGFLSLNSITPNFFSSDQSEPLKAFASQAAVAIRNARLYEQVQRVAITDELTGLFNRRGLMQLGEREVERALRFLRPLCAIMFDIDHFKRINDTYGHPAGDRVLRALAVLCRQDVRSVDIIARYGGEEFVVLLPEANLVSAIQVAERLRDSIEKLCVPIDSGEEICLTVSVGVTEISPDTLDLAALIQRADQAQYNAKQTGRNRVVVKTGS
jgi:diguanylate cyclase (GGDEF)-like protein